MQALRTKLLSLETLLLCSTLASETKNSFLISWVTVIENLHIYPSKEVIKGDVQVCRGFHLFLLMFLPLHIGTQGYFESCKLQ